MQGVGNIFVLFNYPSKSFHYFLKAFDCTLNSVYNNAKNILIYNWSSCPKKKSMGLTRLENYQPTATET